MKRATKTRKSQQKREAFEKALLQRLDSLISEITLTRRQSADDQQYGRSELHRFGQRIDSSLHDHGEQLGDKLDNIPNAISWITQAINGHRKPPSLWFRLLYWWGEWKWRRSVQKHNPMDIIKKANDIAAENPTSRWGA